MDFSKSPMRGAEIWHIWKQHHAIETFWKLLKSVLKIKAMQLQGDGLYTALLILFCRPYTFIWVRLWIATVVT